MTAREEALDILTSVLSEGQYLNLALKKVHTLGEADQRFLTALVTTTLDHLYTIDYILSLYTDLRKASARTVNILRLGVCQIVFMNSVPDRAAVNESVALLRKAPQRFRGFVNGVLRSVVRADGKFPMPAREEDPIRFMSLTYSYPEWICRLFVADLGEEEAEKLLRYEGSPGTTCLRRTALAESESYPDARPGIYLDDALYVPHAASIASDEKIASGAFTVQSEASMLCVRALGLSRDAKVLDLCAAPGGKSCYAAQIASDGEVTACDLHEHRCDLIRSTAKRLHAGNVHAVRHDAASLRPEWKNAFDAVIVDAPCSALGLTYRKPDIRYSRRESHLSELADMQRRILACASEYVRPGGTLVYSTCTIDRAENEENAAWFKETFPSFVPRGLAENLPGAFEERARGASLQILPPRDDIDGFFIARFEKAEGASGAAGLSASPHI